ncbi:MAG: penicillin-binding protein [Clostridia bacterium]|nr:penicillin-binding protein [Clostridia bacterium]
MHKVKNRTGVLLVLLALLLIGLSVYLARYFLHGAEWASYSANSGYYSGGQLAVGRVLDRNGRLLSAFRDGKRVYSDDETTRIATLHAVGDRYGYIGTGAQKVFASKLAGYDLINGAYSLRSGGNDLRLTIDADLEKAAYKALKGRKGAVAVADYVSGDLLCMVSSPAYDPENPPDSFEGEEYEGVFLNRVLSSSYTPGSTFKLVTAYAMLENMPDAEEITFTCTGSLKTDGGEVTCPRAHGEVTLREAMAYSCNCAFGHWAIGLGADVLEGYARKAGLTESLSIDGVATAKGSFRMPESESDLAWSGIGQYKDLVNPAAMLRFVSTVANGGKAPKLRLIQSLRSPVGLPLGAYNLPWAKRIMPESVAGALTDMMTNNVTKVYGSENFPGLAVAAKSGTAEVGSGKEPHALFVGFLTDPETPYAFVVVVENGGRGSTVAGEVANAVLQTAVAKKK